MPASVTVYRASSTRGCPACTETRCSDPADCLHYLTVHPWADCDRCAGSGWAGDASVSVFCGFCAGSGLMEHTHGSAPQEITVDAKARHAAHLARVRALLAKAGALAVAA